MRAAAAAAAAAADGGGGGDAEELGEGGSAFFLLEEAMFCFSRAIRADNQATDALSAARRRRRAQARVNLAALLLRVRSDFGGAEAQCRRSLRDEPSHAHAHFMLGVLLEVRDITR